MIRLKSLGEGWLSAPNKFYLPPPVCINLKSLSFIIGNADVDLLSSYLPTSPPIAPALNIGLVSTGTKMSIACEIPQPVAIKLLLTFINFNLTVDQVEGPVQESVDFLHHPSPLLTGTCLLHIFIFYF